MTKKLMVLISILTVIVVGGVSFLILSSNRTTKAVVLNTAVEPGVVITEDMVTIIDIPAGTPQGYLKNPDSIVGQKSKTRIEKEQLLYVSNFMSSWTNYSDSDKIPADYVITSISLPNERACGGVITAGDYIDVMAVFKYKTDANSWSNNKDESTAQEIYGTGRSDTGTTVAYILSNVYVLNTNSSLSESQQSDASVASNSSGNTSENPFYVIALSYDDCKKLRQVEGLGDQVQLWINISPAQNQVEGNSPLIKQMLGQSYSYLHDAQVPVQDKDGKMLTDNYYVPQEGQGNGAALPVTSSATPTPVPTQAPTEPTPSETEPTASVDPNATNLAG